VYNFSFQNPTKIHFGRGTITKITSEIPEHARIMVVYGGGSIMKNGVFDQVSSALNGMDWVEFGGIEPNPTFETLMTAVEFGRREKVTFLLAVGGGSVVDGTKFLAAAIPFEGDDPWTILKGAPVNQALPLGCVLTLPATGSESNSGAVISHRQKKEKRFFGSPLIFPRFSILDPETTFSLSVRQTINGVVDAFVHVLEQYLTFPVNNPLQDRFAEGILITLIDEAPNVLEDPKDYDARANIMWCGTMALNGLIGSGVPHDWSTHMIGHELTALYGLDHAQTLAIVLPGVLRHQLSPKSEKLAQYSRRIWRLSDPLAAVEKTEVFFRKLGMKTRLSEYGIHEGMEQVGERLSASGMDHLGEHKDLTPEQVVRILNSRL
jgi:NADP-dependent alcohol dehydrogenase